MRSTLGVPGISVAVGVALALVACDGPTRPSPSNTPPPPSPPTPPVITRLSVDGPGTVAPGETAQFTAAGHYSDGSTRNVTNEPGISWWTSNSRVLAISSQGVATGGDRGDTSVTSTFAGLTSVKSDVIVVPSGTYRLSGNVTDTGIGVLGARVEVTHGPARGMVAFASPTFRLYGVSGDTEIRISKDGYHDARLRLQMTSHQAADVELAPIGRVDLAGTYSLTIAAAESCRAALPEEAHVRKYTAFVAQRGPSVTVTLEGARFASTGERLLNRFIGSIERDTVRFEISTFLDYYNYYGYFPDVAEQLTGSDVYVPAGWGLTTVSSTGISGTLSGTIGTMALSGSTWVAFCRSTDHQFVFTRVSTAAGSRSSREPEE